MLRHIVGDSAFFAIMKEWPTRYAHSVVESSDFVALCEELHGESLDWYFEPWLHHPTYPTYAVSHTTTESGDGYDVTVDVAQTQGDGLFAMPVDFRFLTEAGVADTVFFIDDAEETFTIHLAARPDTILIDPDHWVLCDVEGGPVVAVKEPAKTPFALHQNYPNPFNPTTTIQYTLAEPGVAEVAVYNTQGQCVATLVSGYQSAGAHSVTWNAAGYASGLYFARLEAGGMTEVRKMVVMK
jgi:hypothetical protein